MPQSTPKPKYLTHTLGIFLLCIPFIKSTSVLDMALLPRQIAVNVFVIAVSVWLLLKGEKRIQLSTGILLLSGLLLMYGLSFFSSLNVLESWNTFNKMTTATFAFAVLYSLFKQEQLNIIVLSRYALAFCLLADVSVLYEILQKPTVSGGESMYEIRTPFAHKNLFSSVQICALPFLFFTFFNDKRIWKFTALFAVMLWLGLVFFIQTKAVLFALFPACGAAILLLLFSKSLNRKTVIVFSVVAIGLLFAGVLLINAKPEFFSLLFRTNTFQERLFLWDNTAQMIREYWLFGVGAGNWQIYFPKYGLQQFMATNYLIADGFTTFQRPHNDFLWVFAETGIFGFVMYVLFFVYLIVAAVALFFKNAGNIRWVWLAALLSIIMYVVNAAFDFPLERNEHQFLLMMLAAWISASFHTQFKHQFFITKQISSTIIFSVIILVCVFNINVCVARMKGEAQSKKLIAAHGKGNWQQLINAGLKAKNKWYNMDNFSIPVDWYIGVGKFAQNDLKSAKQYFENAYRINPYQVHVLNNYAGLWEKEGNHNEAIKYYDELLRISPTSPDGILNRSAALYNAGRYIDAFYSISKFKWDETESNTQFLAFLDAIVKSYLEERLKWRNQNVPAINYYLSTPEAIKKLYKESYENNIPFSILLHNKLNIIL